MANITKFIIEHQPTGGEIRVEIDFDFVGKIKTENGEVDYPVMTEIKDTVDFWSNSEKRLNENEGSYLNTFLKQLAESVLRILATNNLTLYGVIEEMKGEEGWMPLDGTYGIKLTSIDEPSFSEQDEYLITN